MEMFLLGGVLALALLHIRDIATLKVKVNSLERIVYAKDRKADSPASLTKEEAQHRKCVGPKRFH
jgi:hypothetical protein